MPKVFIGYFYAVSSSLSFDQLKVELELLEAEAKKEIASVIDQDSLEKLSLIHI